ncbi:MAG: FdhF/YdeP family oxidoreductase [Armatimonadetes bacterium]|nr:FdhF/YdeP family oxidoreductase [Armatimonadota bacterium]
MNKPQEHNRTRKKKGWDKASWVSLMPYGFGHIKPNHYLEMAKVVWANRRQLPYAWRILSKGVCDGCALGVTGFHDWTIKGIHLCAIRLNLLELNTMGALDMRVMEDASSLRRMTSSELRALGRIPYPMVRRKGDAGFTRVSWDEALDLIAERIRAANPRRFAMYLTSRGITNEVYYVAQKAMRCMGSNNVDNAARICHSPSTLALKSTLGAAATTCSYTDWMGTDLLIFIGSDTPNNQPVTTKYMYEAKKYGTRILCVNAYREPGLERYWVPSAVESALFGTKLTDEFFMVHTGGDIAFFNGVLKRLIETGAVHEQFISEHTSGWEALREKIAEQSWEELVEASGSTREQMERFAELIGQAKSAVFVWSMGITQHRHGMQNVQSIVNVALSQGFVGREKCGLMPIRGHSGVQGGAEMGAYATVFPGGVPINEQTAETFSRLWSFPVPDWPGLTATEMIHSAAEGELDILYSAGGNFLETLPQPERVELALSKPALRVHQDIVLTSQMLVEPADTVVILPAATRYEQKGGGTETTTERRVLFSPEIPGRRIGEARSEWEIFADLAQRVCPQHASAMHFESGQQIRDDIARAIPFYDGIQHLKKSGDQFQWGGSALCAGWQFNTSDGLAHFTSLDPPNERIPEGKFRLSTRRGKQFNSMVQSEKDSLTGAWRDSVLMSSEDAHALGLRQNDEVILRSDFGEMRCRVYLAPLRPRNLQVHWPEGNVLISPEYTDTAGVPDYNAFVEVLRAAPAQTHRTP